MKITDQQKIDIAKIVVDNITEASQLKLHRIVEGIVSILAKPPLARVRLNTPRDVMTAFLAGHKLINSEYQDGTGEQYLYLDEAGSLCEEDGAGAKPHRVPICMRGEAWWEILE